MRSKRSLERTLGYGILGVALLGFVLLLAQSGVRASVARVAEALAGGSRDGDRILEVPSHEGIDPGLPLYRVLPSGDAAPVGHVVGLLHAPPRIRLRAAPGRSLDGLTSLRVFAPSRKLSAALALGVPGAEARAFASELGARLERLWTRHLLPDVRQRLPAFLDRLDPTKETKTRTLFQGLGNALVERAQPVLDDLLDTVMKAVKDKLGLLDRLGLLWDLIQGDEKEIRDALVPAAKEAAQKWWTDNQSRVLETLGEGLTSQWPDIRAWITGDLLDATLDEMVRPVFAANRDVLEAEGERLMRDVVKRFIEAPGGGFRIRFASLLRHNLLNKKTALLLWLPEEPGDD